MKKEVTQYLVKFLEGHQVKVEHQNPTCLLHALPIPEWKWEIITMYFITRLLKYRRKNDSIMVIVDKLSKSAHFVPIHSTYKIVQIVDLFMREKFHLHGIPKVVIYDRYVKFTYSF